MSYERDSVGGNSYCLFTCQDSSSTKTISHRGPLLPLIYRGIPKIQKMQIYGFHHGLQKLTAHASVGKVWRKLKIEFELRNAMTLWMSFAIP